MNAVAPAAAVGPIAPAHAPGQCLEVAEASREPDAPVQLGPCTSAAHQQFTFPDAGSAGELRAFGGAGEPALCLEADGRAGLHDDPVVTAACSAAPAQRWTRTAAGELRHAVAGRCLDASSGTQAGTPVTLADCAGRLGQGWSPGGPATGRAAFGKALVVGSQHTCGLTAAGRAYCWGANTLSQLGDGIATPPASRPAPHLVAGGHTFVQLAAGGGHTCGLTPAGAAYCWGDNTVGQLGIVGVPPPGPDLRYPSPVPVAGGLAFAAVVAGSAHTCALTAAGEAYCWGYNLFGQLGDGSLTDRRVPTRVAGAPAFAALAAGRLHTCGLTASGQAYCWGANSDGQLGRGTASTPQPVPAPVTQGGVRFAQVDAGNLGFHTCALTASGQAYCWGMNNSGQLGTGSIPREAAASPQPVRQPMGIRFARVEAGPSHTCALTGDGQTYCWGLGYFGDGPDRGSLYPVPAGGGQTWVELANHGEHTCGLRPDGAAFCWGRNHVGQLGAGVAGDPRLVPTAVVGGIVFRVAPRPGETSACSADGRYCLRAGLRYDADDEFQAFSRFEERVGAEWVRRDVRDLRVVCYVDGVLRDRDAEGNASLVDLRFQVRRPGGPTGEPPPVLVACEHAADGGAYRAATRFDGRPAAGATAASRLTVAR